MYNKPQTSRFPTAEEQDSGGNSMGNRTLALAIMSGLAGAGAGIAASDPRRPYAGFGTGMAAGAAAPLSFATAGLQQAFKQQAQMENLALDEQTAAQRGRIQGVAEGERARSRAESRRQQEREESQADVEDFVPGVSFMTPANKVFLGSIAQGIAQQSATQRAAQYFQRGGQ
jgi:hypothetical protein